MPFQNVGRRFFRCIRHGVLNETNDEVGHTDLRTYIEKLCDDTLNEMFVLPNLQAAARSNFRARRSFSGGFADFR
jgi:hypothetical protein